MWRCTAKNVRHACAVVKGDLPDSSVETCTVRGSHVGSNRKEENSELEKGA